MERDISLVGLEDQKHRLDRLKNEKGRLGRLVNEARRSGGTGDHWISEFRDVSQEIKRLQKLIKKQVNGAEVEKKWAPETIAPPPAITEKPLDKPVSVKPCVGDMLIAADEYVGQHPGAAVWHRPLISSFIKQTYGHKARYLCAVTECGKLVGILPVVRLNSRLFGNFMVSMPFFNYGGVLADNADIAHQLIYAADQWRREEGAKHLELRFLQDNKLGLPQRTDKVTFWLPLPDQSDALWNSFKPKLRAQIRRGNRDLSSLSIGGSELLDEFYKVFSVNMRDLGTPVYSRAFFRNLLAGLDGQAWLVVARIGGRAAGCAFLTGYRERMEIPWASTLRKQSHTGINMIMYWKILEFAIEHKFKIFDFGRCTENAGTYRFKEQWGGQPIALHWDYVLPTGERLPELNPDNPKFRLLIAAWRKLPVWAANLLGPRIVRVLP
ncbi:FemAB family PEP-CTERM system-associated protein [Marinobacter sp. M216]|uniref:FemAB family PEP-CTERM system-associated protein n=1 Tax=Marinobacter albus TaxID=3030833 RepID=A0ABT7HBB8_9GAMM|nr:MULTISPECIES: FemAB family XrtA/PEP-CTERM system-associated protein [unclassified Marinobacter]MBW7470070.1 FemAB family PEP-CTERM system-associated protein [Marinobacter sp. F4218]MDK9557666.1 FemAB family PEP-CTERM system-associated protein [Marinobacter sp. M216]